MSTTRQEKGGEHEALTVQVLQRQDGEDVEDADPATGHSNLHTKCDTEVHQSVGPLYFLCMPAVFSMYARQVLNSP